MLQGTLWRNCLKRGWLGICRNFNLRRITSIHIWYDERVRGPLGRSGKDVREGLKSVSVDITKVSPTRLTTRASPAFIFRTVRGVLPRSFPGVLNISATLLP